MQSEISQNFKAVIKTTIFVCATVFSLSACEKQGSGSAAQPAAAAAQVPVAVPATQQELLASREPSANAAPLGLEIGFANLAGVKHKLGGMTNLESIGTNEYSEGPMLRSSGEGLGVDGLSQLLLIFDKDNVLVGVVMTLPKAPKDVLQKLSEKYQVVDNRIDAFMNNFNITKKGLFTVESILGPYENLLKSADTHTFDSCVELAMHFVEDPSCRACGEHLLYIGIKK